MKTRFVLFGFIIILGNFVIANSSADFKHIILEPVLRYSFCTVRESGATIGIVGDNWALKIWFRKNDFFGRFTAQDVRLHQGPNMYKYIGRSAGPRRPPPPSTDEYSMVILPDVTVNVNKIKIFDGAQGKIKIAVSDFSVDGKIFHIRDQVYLECRDPLP